MSDSIKILKYIKFIKFVQINESIKFPPNKSLIRTIISGNP